VNARIWAWRGFAAHLREEHGVVAVGDDGRIVGGEDEVDRGVGDLVPEDLKVVAIKELIR
jgi:hypothetical protein